MSNESASRQSITQELISFMSPKFFLQKHIKSLKDKIMLAWQCAASTVDTELHAKLIIRYMEKFT